MLSDVLQSIPETSALMIKAPEPSSSRYGCIRGWICRFSTGYGELLGFFKRPPGSNEGSLDRYAFPHQVSIEAAVPHSTSKILNKIMVAKEILSGLR